MKRLVLLTLILILGIGVYLWAAEKGKPKIPHPGGVLTPLEAYQMLIQDPEQTFLIDCRSMAEYELVGHPPMAYNIPYKSWTPEGLKINHDFVKDVSEKFKKTDRLLIICRSGKRSRNACSQLVGAGFKNVFNVSDGFEGDMVRDSSSPHYGHRRYVNGWQHDGLPYTYECEKKLIYKLHSPCDCE